MRQIFLEISLSNTILWSHMLVGFDLAYIYIFSSLNIFYFSYLYTLFIYCTTNIKERNNK